MASMKTVFATTMLIVFVAQSGLIIESQAQGAPPALTCSNALTGLNACAPFVVPGGGAPSSDCCLALQGVDHRCLCNTLQIVNSIPTQCNLPSFTCSA